MDMCHRSLQYSINYLSHLSLDFGIIEEENNDKTANKSLTDDTIVYDRENKGEFIIGKGNHAKFM